MRSKRGRLLSKPSVVQQTVASTGGSNYDYSLSAAEADNLTGGLVAVNAEFALMASVSAHPSQMYGFDKAEKLVRTTGLKAIAKRLSFVGATIAVSQAPLFEMFRRASGSKMNLDL